MNIKNIINRALHFIEDPHCMICGEALEVEEYGVCERCIKESGIFDAFQLQVANNPLERRMHGSRISAVSALMVYERGEVQQRMIEDLKYNNVRKMAKILGRAMGERVMRSERYQGIDCIVPVPLHVKKERKRGYNQSELIAREVARVTNIPLVTDKVMRMTNNASQAKMSIEERMKAEIEFRVTDREFFEGKTVLLIDDVFTTGSTILNCAGAFDGVREMDIKVFSVASPLGR